MKIVIEISPDPYTPTFSAIDSETYDAEVSDGEWVGGPMGSGSTPWEAARDLIDQLEEV